MDENSLISTLKNLKEKSYNDYTPQMVEDHIRTVEITGKSVSLRSPTRKKADRIALLFNQIEDRLAKRKPRIDNKLLRKLSKTRSLFEYN